MANHNASWYIKSSKAAPEAWAALERLGREWYGCGPGDTARKKVLQNEIFMRLDKLCSREWDSAIGTFWEKDWQRFDPNQGSLENYVRARLPLRRQDDEKKERGWYKGTATDPKTGKKIINPKTEKPKRIWKDPKEKDMRTEGGEWINPIEILPDSAVHKLDERFFLDETACQLLTLMLQMEINLQGKRGNSVRFRYFRMFFTNDVVNIVHTDGAPDPFLRRERDLFEAIYVCFLDYFMHAPCRSVVEILHTRLKPYGELVENREMEETPLPLPQDVYISYLKREENYSAGRSAISQQMDAYREYLSSLLDQKYE